MLNERLILLLCVSGCVGTIDTAGKDTSTDPGTTDSDSGTTETGETGETGETETTIPYVDLCGLHFSERWAFDGECPRMKTPCELTVADEATCNFDIAYSSGMTMGMPYAMTITGTSVSFGDGDQLSGCVGTIVDGDNIEGTCDSGCTFELYRITEE